MTAFPCTSCGCCCWNVRGILPAAEDGSCLNLAADRKTCKIYANRPAVCRVDDARPRQIPEGEWRELNISACKSLRRHYGVPEPEEAIS